MNHEFRKPPLGMATALALATVLLAGLASGQLPSAAATITDAVDPSVATAEMMPRAQHSMILDLVDGAERAVAVGERGQILVSESRKDWRQIENVPTRSTLTAVTAVGNQLWAVGHDGVILHSSDGGLAWQRQRAMPYDPESTDLHNGVPLLDVLMLDASNGFAIGAYALMLRTSDGGATWTQVAVGGSADSGDEEIIDDAEAEGDDTWSMSADDTAIEGESDPHLNAIARTGDGSLFIVAERGAAFRSTDGGTTWQRLSLPYDGSMFGVIGFEARHVLAFGLRGNVFESLDLGDNWSRVESGETLSLMGGAGFANGGAVLVGANGIVLTRAQGNDALVQHTHPDVAVLSSVLILTPNGELMLAGENGLGNWTPN